MKIPDAIAGLVVRRPFALLVVLLGIAGASLWVVASKTAFDSEILNLLPAGSPEVEGLKIYNRDFSQTRELAFLLQSEDAAELADYHAEFLDALAREPWVRRVAAGPPMESPGGSRTMPEFAAPLLAGLPPEEFAGVLSNLQTDRLEARMQRIAAGIQMGSPRAQLEAEWDLLGVFEGLAGRLSEAMEADTSFSFSSPDGTAFIVSVITTQEGTDAVACREMMRQVRTFLEEFRASHGSDAPEILVTGRSAYVEEISASMRSDILRTSLASAVGIAFLFLVFYRAIRPLAGMLVILLTVSVTSLALGMMVFRELNLIAIAFCSILFGLGSDFALLLLQKFRFLRQGDLREKVVTALRTRMPQIAGVALTTSIGFLALCLSSSRGFVQLGVLTALGILLCAGFFAIWLFLFLPRKWKNDASSPADSDGFQKFQLLVGKHPGLFHRAALGLAVISLALAISPWRPVGFDASPASLEPRNAPAAIALNKMMAAFPDTFEPVLTILPAKEPGEDLDEILRLELLLGLMLQNGEIRGYSKISPFLPNMEQVRANQEAAERVDWEQLRGELREAAQRSGLQLGEAHSATRILELLQRFAEQGMSPLRWNETLPQDSPWWFLLDRSFAPDGSYALLAIQPGDLPLSELSARIRNVLPEALPTGWALMLQSLVPWAEQELRLFVFGVATAILVVLALYYRDWVLWGIHAASLVFTLLLIVLFLKIFAVQINLLNVLAFPLLIGVGVDYAMHLLSVIRETGDRTANLLSVLRPVVISGLTTMTGFGALLLAENPALSGLGALCVIGVGSALLVALVFVYPLAATIRAMPMRKSAVRPAR